MLAPLLKSAHAGGVKYEEYLDRYPGKADAWRSLDGRAALEPDQLLVLTSFTRRMPVICISGIWCGDCALQGPMLAAIAAASEMIDLVFVDRDEHRELSDRFRIAGGNRVPTVIWMTEEFEFVHMLGDRTLSRCRAMAARSLGASCELPGARRDPDEGKAVLAEWVREFERVHWILRLSPRLRQLHGD